MMKISRDAAVKLLKHSVFVYDDILSWMESNGGWLDFRDEYVNLFASQKIKWWEFYRDKEIFSRLAFISLSNICEGVDITDANSVDKFIQDINHNFKSSDFDAIPDEEFHELMNYSKEEFSALSDEQQKQEMRASGIIIASFVTSLFNYLAIMAFGKRMYQLVSDAINGNDKAFISAVQIDRATLLLPEFQERIIRAQFSNQGGFLESLSYRIKNPIIRGKIRYRTLWLTFAILDDLGHLDLPHDELLDICEEVGVYGKDYGINDVNHLSKRLREYRKQQGNSKII